MTMNDNDFLALHKKYAPDGIILQLVWQHSLIVKNITSQIIDRKNLKLNRKLVIQGCLMHDIGVYFVEPCKCHPKSRKENEEPYVKHGVIGADIIRKEKLSEKLAKIVERHVGSGITKEQIIEQNFALPRKDLVPETVEEKLVAYADMFHSKKPKFNEYKEITDELSIYGKDCVQRLKEWRKMFGIPNINLKTEIEKGKTTRKR
jgi:uncharacterized protein